MSCYSVITVYSIFKGRDVLNQKNCLILKFFKFCTVWQTPTSAAAFEPCKPLLLGPGSSTWLCATNYIFYGPFFLHVACFLQLLIIFPVSYSKFILKLHPFHWMTQFLIEHQPPMEHQ